MATENRSTPLEEVEAVREMLTRIGISIEGPETHLVSIMLDVIRGAARRELTATFTVDFSAGKIAEYALRDEDGGLVFGECFRSDGRTIDSDQEL